MNIDLIRNILNILFMALALAAVITTSWQVTSKYSSMSVQQLFFSS